MQAGSKRLFGSVFTLILNFRGACQILRSKSPIYIKRLKGATTATPHLDVAGLYIRRRNQEFVQG